MGTVESIARRDAWKARAERAEAEADVFRRVILDLPIEMLRHEVRKPALEALIRNRISTLGQLVRCDAGRIYGMRNVGVTGVNEIRDALKLRGLALEGKLPGED